MVFSVRFLYRRAIPSRIWGEGGVRATIMDVVLLTHTQRRRLGKKFSVATECMCFGGGGGLHSTGLGLVLNACLMDGCIN